MKDLSRQLKERKQQSAYRRRRTISRMQGTQIEADGKSLLNFCSNDYLGLARDARVVDSFRSALDRYGAGSGSAHLVTGHSSAHHALEEELADFTGRPRALLFSSGYLANLGTITSLANAGDTVLQDRLNHASLIDGGRLSGARLRRYHHLDTASLAVRLDESQGAKLVVSDGVFSMDGDVAPLPDLAQLCAGSGAWLMVDDAHGMGVLGKNGAGTLEHFGLGIDDVPVLMGTLGKAFGTAGAFVAGSEELIESLIQNARSYIYTTALPAAIAEATREALRIIRAENWRRERLQELIGKFRQEASGMGLGLQYSATPIQPLIAGSTALAVRWSRQLEQQGILVAAIRPPTVPSGTARLRITFSTDHSDAQLERLLQALSQLDDGEAQ